MLSYAVFNHEKTKRANQAPTPFQVRHLICATPLCVETHTRTEKSRPQISLLVNDSIDMETHQPMEKRSFTRDVCDNNTSKDLNSICVQRAGVQLTTKLLGCPAALPPPPPPLLLHVGGSVVEGEI